MQKNYTLYLVGLEPSAWKVSTLSVDLQVPCFSHCYVMLPLTDMKNITRVSFINKPCNCSS
jgi:hypothetical protein